MTKIYSHLDDEYKCQILLIFDKNARKEKSMKKQLHKKCKC